jgi:glycosyltransferase 2 family protein
MWVLYKDISWENDLLPALKKVKWPWVYASFLFGYIATLLRGLRWNIMLEPMGYKVRDWWAVHAVAFGYCMNNLIPRSGELARCTLLNRTDHVPVNKLIGTVLLERIVDIVLMATLIFLAYVLEQDAFHSIFAHAEGSRGTTLVILLIAVIAAFMVFLYLLRRFEHIPFFKKVREFMLGMMDGLKSIFRLKRQGLFWIYSFGIWIFWLLMTYTSLLALEETCTMTLRQTVFFMAASSLGMMVPTPGGAGAFHGMAVLGLQALGFPADAGKIYALISWSIKTTWDILVGAVSFLLATSRK